MKTTPDTLEQNKFLISEDSRRIGHQRLFIETLAKKFTEFIQEFNALETEASFDLKDIDRIESQSALSFIKGKVLPTIKEPVIAGKKSTPEKVFELMDLPLSGFTHVYNDIKEFLVNTRRNTAMLQYNLMVDFKSRYFIIEGNQQVIVDYLALESWNDTYCRNFADNEKKAKAWKLMNQIAESLNELRDLSPKQQGSQTFERLRSDYKSIVLSSISRLVNYNDSKKVFEVKTDGYITAF